MVKMRAWGAAFLLGCFGHSAHAILPTDDPWEFCARNHANVRVCFTSLQAAEEWIRQEPATPNGRRFLEPSGKIDLSGAVNNPSWVWHHYTVKPRPPESVAEMYLSLVNLSSSYGLGCDCPDSGGVTPSCIAVGGNNQRYKTPVLGAGCISSTGDITPLKQALENHFSDKCEVAIEDQGSYPDSAHSTHIHKIFRDTNYGPWAGRLVYNNLHPWLDGPTLHQLNKIIKVSHGELVNGQCVNVSVRNEMAVSREDRIGCDEGLEVYPGNLHPLSLYQSSMIGYGDICRSRTTAYIEARQLPSNQCPYGNPCNPGSGEKVWDETDAAGAVPLSRSYSSLALGRSDVLGPGWSLGYSARLIVPIGTSSPTHILAVDAHGRMERYDRVGAGPAYRSRNTPGDVLTRVDGQSWQLDEASGRTAHFDAQGRLLWQQPGKDPSQRLTLEYATATTITGTMLDGVVKDHLAAVTDTRGRRLAFTYSYASHQPNCGTSTPNPACGSLRLVRVDLPDGGTLRYDYDAEGRLDLVTQPDDSARAYHYNEPDHLCPSAMPGACTGGTPPTGGFPHALTGISDIADVQNPQPARYATYQYDHRGRVISSQHSGGVNRLTLAYPSHTQAVLRFARPGGDLVRTINYTIQSGLFRKEGGYTETDAASNPIRASATTFDSQGRTLTRTDPQGNVTRYEYTGDTLHRSATIEAEGTPEQRRTETDWGSALNRVTETRTRDAQNALVALERTAYNARGQVTAHCRIDPASPNATYICGSQANAPAGVRQSRTVYCDAQDLTPPDPIGTGENLARGCPLVGLVRRVDGPRTDVADIATYEYRLADAPGCDTAPATCAYRVGDLWKTTNALGHVAEIVAYDGAGRVLESKDANGVTTQLAYHPRGWLASRTVKGAIPAEDAVTSFAYGATGQITRVTQPDGDFLDYEYDDAHRLVAIQDAAGHRIEYTLDVAGNRTAEVTKDANAAITRQLSRTYDLLSRLIEQRDAHNQPTQFAYDANGNQTEIEDALGIQTGQTHDPLNRLKQTLQDVGGIEAETGFEYDALDRLTKVTDPKGLDTDYHYDGLGNLVQLTSPDTGIATYAYDAAGNRLTQTDARGITATYTYDALNRLTGIAYPDSSLDVAYYYDEANLLTGCAASLPQGRLTRMIDASGTTAWCYDRRGNVAQKRLTHGSQTRTVGYTYTLGDRLGATTYPDGTVIEYTRNALGQVATITQTGITPTQPIVTATAYRPFGPIAQIVFAGGASQTFTHDGNDWTTAIAGTALTISYDHDARGNIESITEAAQTRSYDYDPLSRLTQVQDNSLPLEGFDYDATGNRQSKTTPSGTQAYAYPLDSHRLAAIDTNARSYDAMGNLTARGTQDFVHGHDQRLKRVTQGSTTLAAYRHNGRGERTRKQTDLLIPGGGNLSYSYIYDEHGRLLAEYRTSDWQGPQFHRLYVWLDDRLVALQAKADAYADEWLHIHTDHLGTPRAITRPSQSNTTVWRWGLTQTAFGEHAPDEDPDGDSHDFIFNLRYPGQYYDAETGLHYNYFRDYEPGTGRYIESDPIGLKGGINTYAYVGALPLSFIDPLGLRQICKRVEKPLIDWVDGRGNVQVGTYSGLECFDVPDLPMPSPEFCEYGNCTCYQRCVNQETIFGLGGNRAREVGSIAMSGLGVGGGAATAAAGGTGAAAVASAACGVISLGIGTFELTARVRCSAVCSINPTWY